MDLRRDDELLRIRLSDMVVLTAQIWGSRASWRCVVNPTRDSCTGALQLQHLQSDKRAHQPLIHLTSGNKGISLKSVIFGQGFYFSASSSIVGPMKLQNKVADQHITKYPGVL